MPIEMYLNICDVRDKNVCVNLHINIEVHICKYVYLGVYICMFVCAIKASPYVLDSFESHLCLQL